MACCNAPPAVADPSVPTTIVSYMCAPSGLARGAILAQPRRLRSCTPRRGEHRHPLVVHAVGLPVGAGRGDIAVDAEVGEDGPHGRLVPVVVDEVLVDDLERH